MHDVELLRRVRELEVEKQQAVRRYLETAGWEYTCQTPGAYWLWQKTLPDGRQVLVNESHAVSMQQALDALGASCVCCGAEIKDDEEPVDEVCNDCREHAADFI